MTRPITWATSPCSLMPTCTRPFAPLLRVVEEISDHVLQIPVIASQRLRADVAALTKAAFSRACDPATPNGEQGPRRRGGQPGSPAHSQGIRATPSAGVQGCDQRSRGRRFQRGRGRARAFPRANCSAIGGNFKCLSRRIDCSAVSSRIDHRGDLARRPF
jgi:hypothetical protein